MFGTRLTELAPIKEAVATYISRAAEKLRAQGGSQVPTRERSHGYVSRTIAITALIEDQSRLLSCRPL